MKLSYTGTVFRRILISSGYTYGKRMKVSYTHLQTKYMDEYKDLGDVEFTYRRGESGRWVPYPRLEYFDKEYEFWNALCWLEDNGYIKISWYETVQVSRLCTGKDHFINLTEKALQIAPKYLA